MQLIIEHTNEFKLTVYKQAAAVTSDGQAHFFTVYCLHFELQAVSDDEIFLHVHTGDKSVFLNLNQSDALLFLEKILECGGYYTFDGVMRPHEREVYCRERYVNIKNKIQEVWDIREKILYWLSYGNIGGGFNAINS